MKEITKNLELDSERRITMEKLRVVTTEMLSSVSFTTEDLVHLSGNPTDKMDLVGDLVSPNGELFFVMNGEIFPRHFVCPELGSDMESKPMQDTPENRVRALVLAEKDHAQLSPQERAATRTAVWVEDGLVFWSGQWSGYSQPPEGEVTARLELDRDAIEEFKASEILPKTPNPVWDGAWVCRVCGSLVQSGKTGCPKCSQRIIDEEGAGFVNIWGEAEGY